MSSNLGEDDKNAVLEMMAAMPRIMQVVADMTETVVKAFSPALEGRTVQSCLHILDDINKQGILPMDASEGLPGRQPMLCPKHPQRLICNQPECQKMHYLRGHDEELGFVPCLVCGHLTSFLEAEPIDGEVLLHRKLPFFSDSRRRDGVYAFSGTVGILPAAWLCPRHAEAVDLPIRMAWPTLATDDVQPEDVYRLV
jgi:hypothetical protein